jgi:hypothetical protein
LLVADDVGNAVGRVTPAGKTAVPHSRMFLNIDEEAWFDISPSATNQRDLAGLIRAERNFAAVRAFVFVRESKGHHEGRTDCSSH